jgi:hypothetical protein
MMLFEDCNERQHRRPLFFYNVFPRILGFCIMEGAWSECTVFPRALALGWAVDWNKVGALMSTECTYWFILASASMRFFNLLAGPALFRG